jgi:hypothetical protein
MRGLSAILARVLAESGGKIGGKIGGHRRSGSSRIQGLGFRASKHFKTPLGLMD